MTDRFKIFQQNSTEHTFEFYGILYMFRHICEIRRPRVRFRQNERVSNAPCFSTSNFLLTQGNCMENATETESERTVYTVHTIDYTVIVPG